ncbi:MAG: hypothetical protein C0432_02535 [Candidatus Puniceispirillum sp.]|nr:hypothetical protein [Candidatus Pelagibacter sp.]MBA4283152.1 hypothetical protein [Candidatus Puniceispirillum sp.]
MTYTKFQNLSITYQHPTLQVAFLFKSLRRFLQEAEEKRDIGDFESFSRLYQKAIFVMYGLKEFFQTETKEDYTKTVHGVNKNQLSWEIYFESLISTVNQLAQEKNKKALDDVLLSLDNMIEVWSHKNKK